MTMWMIEDMLARLAELRRPPYPWPPAWRDGRWECGPVLIEEGVDEPSENPTFDAWAWFSHWHPCAPGVAIDGFGDPVCTVLHAWIGEVPAGGVCLP